MSDQPLAFDSLDDFFRSFARPELDRAVEEKMAESLERGRRLHLRSLHGSFDFLEKLYGFLRADVRRVERSLDEIHLSIDRHELREGPRLENARFKHEQSVAARNRQVGYLARLDEHIQEFVDFEGKDGLQARSAELRRCVDELATPLAMAGARLDRYTLRSEVNELAARADALREDVRLLAQRLDTAEPALRQASARS